MRRKILSFGFDIERPYGKLAETDQGIELRKNQMDFVRSLNEEYDKEGIPRTFFILGDYLDACLKEYDLQSLRELYDKKNPLVEIQQHSYSHPMIRQIEGRSDKVFTPSEFAEDLQKANHTLEDILGVTPDGLRFPLGYSHDLSDLPEIVSELKDMGFKYVSSNLRGKNSLNAPLSEQRQPHDYSHIGFHDIVEIPGHGWQDVIFTREKSRQILNREPASTDKIFEHYNELLRMADEIDLPNVSVALCLHPWSVMEYDPKLEIHKSIVDSARKKGFEILSYGDVADQYY